ncbi:MAG: thioredoxin family protein [Neptuniibacter sp.]
MKTIPILLLAFLVSTGTHAQQTELMKYSGSAIESPYWFKDSFLDIADDIQEAQDDGKKLIIYFHQAGCPYCYNLVQQSLLDPALSQYIQENFDLVALDLWGDREVTLPDGSEISEKELAIKWKVQFTPTLLFFSDSEMPVLRIDGYRSRVMLAKVLEYVVSGDTETSLSQNLNQRDQSAVLYPSVAFQPVDALSELKPDKPVALLFEYPGCEDCTQLHKRVLSRTDTFKQLEKFHGYRFDVSDPQKVTLPDGTELTGSEYAEKLGLTYYPSLVLMDASGEERLRVDAYVQAFHFNTALEYVSQKVYLRVPEFQRYINERADKLREEGQEVVITQ